MLTNATLKQIERLTGATGIGRETFAADPAVNTRCFVAGIKSGQRWDLGATIKDATKMAVLYKNLLAAQHITPPAVGDKLQVTTDGDTPWTGQAVAIVNNQFGRMSHFEVYLKPV